MDIVVLQMVALSAVATSETAVRNTDLVEILRSIVESVRLFPG